MSSTPLLYFGETPRLFYVEEAEMHIHRSNSPSKSPEIPVWLAALIAADCKAISRFEAHGIHWSCAGGRAVYTNLGRMRESVQPFGLTLEPGDTLAVSWRPSETEYTLELCRGERAERRLAA